jgi:CRISPR-associated protein Csx10
VTRTHNTVEDAFQTPTETVGGVYSYEMLPAGARMKSEVRIRKVLRDALGIGQLDGVEVAIGRAKKAGYGSVRIAPEAACHLVTNAANRTDCFTLYAASDILLPAGPVDGVSPSPAAFLCAAIRPAAGVNVEIVDGEVRTGRTEGWVARWGLPRPSHVVIRAGSTVVVTAASAGAQFASDVGARLEQEGLGARRGEGFGHVLVDPSLVTTPLNDSVALPDKRDDVHHDGTADASKYADFAETIENAAVREAIKLRAELAVVEVEGRKDKLGWVGEKPNMSQLGALRAVMGGLQTDGDLDRAGQFVARLRKTDRVTKWGGDNPDAGIHPLRILEGLFGAPDRIWRMIDFAEPKDREWQSVLIGRQPSQARDDRTLQRFAIANLLFAAMRAHKRAMEGTGTAPGRRETADQET